MKRKAEEEAPDSDGEEATKSDSALLSLDPSDDMCEALMRRYVKSTAPQHRHLCASAAAMRSMLLEEGLPLSPPAYLAAAVHNLRSTGGDPSAASAIAAFLSILVPLIQEGELSTTKAKDTISILAEFLKENNALPTGTVRSIVRVLGLLVLRAEVDWEALELPFRTLLTFSVDKRPKVRKGAQEFVEKIFTFLKSSGIMKKAEKVILDIFDKYIPSIKKLSLAKTVDSSKTMKAENAEESELIHFLNLLKLAIPHLSEKSRRKCFFESYKLLTPEFFVLTKHILILVEVCLVNLDSKCLSGEYENFVCSLMAYVSKEKNPADTVVIGLKLLKDGLNKLKDIQPDIWSKCLPPMFEVASGYISSDGESSQEIGSTLKELVFHIDGRSFLKSKKQIVYLEMESSNEAKAIKSICSSLCKALSTAQQPTESVLGVISVLFLKLDESSGFFMKEIALKLSEQAADLQRDMPIVKNVQECFGCAVIAMGPEKIISLVPVSLNEENSTCSNTWLIPILNKYTMGSSLRCFIDHIVPVADSVKKTGKKGKKGTKQRVIQSWISGLWGLLPAFCRYPSDIKECFGVFVELLIRRLKQESSLHEIISKALQELINRNKTLCSGNQEGNVLAELMCSLSLQPNRFDFTKKIYSEKSARKNLKVLASHSMELISAFSDIFFDASVEKRAYLKDALRCLASVAESVNICTFYLSLVKRHDLADADMENKKANDQDTGTDKKDAEKDNSNEKQDTKRSLLLELASTFIEVADEDLLKIVFDFIRTSLLSDAESCHGEAFFALSCILKEKIEFSISRVDEIMLLLHNVKSSSDNTTIVNRLSCYQHLLVHMLKVNEENMNNKAFLILNEIILALKSKKESRSLAYDVLLATSSCLKNNAQSDLQRLFTMVMGYLSSPSPQITSGAISALSLLIFNDAEFCLEVPNLIPSVLILLQNKSNEVIKAALGFVKVLVSTLETDKLVKLQGEILKGILPWSAVSKFHFRSKVGIIIEILIRKCGFGSVDMAVPHKYKGFLKTTAEARQNKKNPKEGDDDSEKVPESEHSSPNKRPKKANTDDLSGSGKRNGFGPKGSAGKMQRFKKHKLNNTSENSVKIGKGNLKFQPQAKSKEGLAEKRKRNAVSKQPSHPKKQKDFRKTKLDSDVNKGVSKITKRFQIKEGKFDEAT